MTDKILLFWVQNKQIGFSQNWNIAHTFHFSHLWLCLLAILIIFFKLRCCSMLNAFQIFLNYKLFTCLQKKKSRRWKCTKTLLLIIIYINNIKKRFAGIIYILPQISTQNMSYFLQTKNLFCTVLYLKEMIKSKMCKYVRFKYFISLLLRL